MPCSEVLALPFTAGNVYTSSNGRIHHDGSISTVVFVTSALAFITVLISLQANSTSLDPVVMRLSLTVVVAAGICSIVYLLRIAKRQERTTVHPEPTACFHRLQLAILWLLGLGVMLICILSVCRLIFCVSEIIDVMRRVEISVDICYHIARLLLVATEVLFISFFCRVKFEHRLSTYHALLFIVLANSSVWIYFYLALNSDTSSDIPGVDNATAVEMNNISACYTNSTLGHLAQQVYYILFPINTEFSLLVLKFVLEMWSLDVNQSQGATHRASVMGITLTTEIEDDGPTSDLDEARPSQQSINERSNLLDTRWEYRLHNSNEYPTHNKSSSLPFLIALIISVCLFLPLAVMYLLLEFRFPGEGTFYMTTMIYEAVYKFVLFSILIVTWFYLYHDCEPIRKQASLSGKDYIILLATFGAATYYFHVIIAGSLIRGHIGAMDIMSNTISMASLYLQTTLLLQTKRYIPKRNTKRQFPSFRSLCTILSVLNFGYWITDSFAGMKFKAAFVPNVEVFGSEYWVFIMRYLFPLVIYYRLESGFTFLKIYGDFSRKNIAE
ncbi:uncharacterized protein [Argopecten irradians]|uniref:uncharacterized protein n=1 Tax=Argopecten irradians TaxID=31199 RepID=UPI0037200CD2